MSSAVSTETTEGIWSGLSANFGVEMIWTLTSSSSDMSMASMAAAG
jgi:hypothetical protein